MQRRLPGRLGRAARLAPAALGLAFVGLGVAKLADPIRFAAVIETYGIVTGTAATRWLAYALIAAEIGLGSCLLLGVGGRRALAAPSAMLASFAALNAWAWAAGQQHECGCFGSLLEVTPAQMLGVDLVLLCLAGLGFAQPLAPRSGRWRGRASLAAVLAAAAAAPLMALLAPPLADGSTLADIGVEAHLPWDPPAQALYGFLEPLRPGAEAEALEALARSGLRVVALSSADTGQIEAFRWRTGPSFDIVTLPRVLLRSLSGDRPGAFLISDGRVAGVWRTRAPVAGEVEERNLTRSPGPEASGTIRSPEEEVR